MLHGHEIYKNEGECLHELNGFCMKISHRDGCPSRDYRPAKCLYTKNYKCDGCEGNGYVYTCTTKEKETCLDFKRWDSHQS